MRLDLKVLYAKWREIWISSNYHIFVLFVFAGQVAMIVGNVRVSDEVEVYSPNGKCSYNLRRVPTPIIPQPLLVNRIEYWKNPVLKSGFLVRCLNDLLTECHLNNGPKVLYSSHLGHQLEHHFNTGPVFWCQLNTKLCNHLKTTQTAAILNVWLLNGWDCNQII